MRPQTRGTTSHELKTFKALMLSCSYELRVKNTNDELGLPVEDIVAVDVPAKPGQGGHGLLLGGGVNRR